MCCKSHFREFRSLSSVVTCARRAVTGYLSAHTIRMYNAWIGGNYECIMWIDQGATLNFTSLIIVRCVSARLSCIG